MPDLSLERAAGGLVAGVDEAGRGPWAGPVVAAAAVVDPAALPPEIAIRIDDSKVLSRAQRTALFPALARHCRIGLGAASVREIDRLNVLEATMLAMARAVARLDCRPDIALVDGNRAPRLDCRVETVIKGDQRSLSIAAASIAAKVMRDHLMERLGRRYPAFGWERNAGYGTAEHRAALLRQGVTRHHRRSFSPIVNVLNRKND